MRLGVCVCVCVSRFMHGCVRASVSVCARVCVYFVVCDCV